MEPRQEAEERLTFLEGTDRKIKDSSLRETILDLYTELIKDLDTSDYDTLFSLNDKQRYLHAIAIIFRQSVSTLMGEDEMQRLFGSNESMEAMFVIKK